MHVDVALFVPLQRRDTNGCAPGLGMSSGFWQVDVRQNCFLPLIHIIQTERQYNFFSELQRPYWVFKLLVPLIKLSDSRQQLNVAFSFRRPHIQ